MWVTSRGAGNHRRREAPKEAVAGAAVSRSIVSSSLQPCGDSRWRSPGKKTGVGGCSLLQRLFLTQGSNPSFLFCRQTLYHLSHKEAVLSAKCLGGEVGQDGGRWGICQLTGHD